MEFRLRSMPASLLNRPLDPAGIAAGNISDKYRLWTLKM
jgi:hypothetical protein